MSAKKKQGGAAKAKEPPPIAVNRRARFDYEIIEKFEAGIVLQGSEVKTLRTGQVTLEEAFARLRDDELFLVNCHIPEYQPGTFTSHEPLRRRKLLLHRRELRRIKAQLEQKGLTLVPTRLYWGPRGHAKVQIAVARGKKKQDKRQTLRKRDDQRLMQGM